MTDNPYRNRDGLGFELQRSANHGELAKLQSQLARWEAEITGDSISQADHLGFMPIPAERYEVYGSLGRTYHPDEPVDLICIMLNRLMIQASRQNQVDVIKYILDERRWPVLRIAVQRAMATCSFGVLEVFQEHGWDVNEPVKLGHCPILRMVVDNEARVRWCLKHGADPNARSDSGYMDVLSHAGQYASVPTLRLLAAYGANFRCSNALHRAAEREGTEQAEALLWLLDEGGVPINQREFEYDESRHYMDTALHCAVDANSLESVQVLLKRGIDVTLQDEKGRTARERAQHLGHGEAVAMVDG